MAITTLSVKIIDLVSHTTYVVCVNFIHKWWDGTYCLKSTPNDRFFVRYFSWQFYLWCFLFYQKNVHFISKNAILCLFLKHVLPSKRVICFILNNLHFPMVEGIAFYSLYKSRILIIIPCKADDFCLFIGLPDAGSLITNVVQAYTQPYSFGGRIKLIIN